MSRLTDAPLEMLNISEDMSRSSNKLHTVYVRLMFLRIGEIDTLNEKYTAQASIEARWAVDIDKILPDLSSEDQTRLISGKSVSPLTKYSQTNWVPQLYIENALGDLKEQIGYTAKKSKVDNQIYVCEHRDIKGLFWEKLELHHFPSDTQELSISIASMFYNDRVLLVPDPQHASGVNLEAFVDQQEWKLYAYVNSIQRFVDEFDFHSAARDDDEDSNTNEDRKRPIVTVTCHVARQSQYFYWNGYCLIFFIMLISFTIFCVPIHQMANRIQSGCTLLLTSITFRWTVNRSLPTISYLTSLDKYGILGIVYLVIHVIWHAVIGTLLFENEPGFVAKPGMTLVKIDRLAFFISLGIFVITHIALILWLYFVPLKHRREMEKKHKELKSVKVGKMRNTNVQSGVGKKYVISTHERIPLN
ncbi:unnamed protein product [Adineta steineri]|uniref:Neurotransmitter-gated ion-channel ligand-binding domain-containing protein n=1 Tax=Adineta steineri TaxID=433720 RepID=A0A815REC5_9BILA|nr:unnamed protein product [Adineta steineri]CAF3986308.1 unnamed protein product [Adineta steineri]